MEKFKGSRLFFLLLSLVFNLVPDLACGLGFGQIKLFSYLNERLNAEIELVGTEDVDLNNVVATLAPSRDFEKIHLARPYYLTQLRFEVVKKENRSFIRVRTDTAVKQAFLEFLVVLNWPDGRLVRGYTLLFDPAPFDKGPKRKTEDLKAALELNQEGEEWEQIYKKGKVSGRFGSIKSMDNRQTLARADLEEYSSDLPPEHSHGSVGSFENLFETGEDSESDNEVTSIIQRSPPVSVGSTRNQILTNKVRKSMPIAEQVPSVIKKTPSNEEIPVVAPVKQEAEAKSLKIISDKMIVLSFKKNKWLFLGSSLALIVVVLLSTWFLKRARGSVRLAKSVELPEKEKKLDLIDPEFDLRLHLAKNYVSIQDMSSAKQILEEVMTYGNQKEKKAAMDLLAKDPHSLQNISEEIPSH